MRGICNAHGKARTLRGSKEQNSNTVHARRSAGPSAPKFRESSRFARKFNFFGGRAVLVIEGSVGDDDEVGNERQLDTVVVRSREY